MAVVVALMVWCGVVVSTIATTAEDLRRTQLAQFAADALVLAAANHRPLQHLQARHGVDWFRLEIGNDEVSVEVWRDSTYATAVAIRHD